jgi:HTH DNA binding domain
MNLVKLFQFNSCYKTPMDQRRKSWDGGEPETVAEEPDPWFRPVWADTDEEDADTPPRGRPLLARAVPVPAADRTDILLGPLAAASAALGRLDAMADMASEPVREGLIARLAYAEAAGRLASQGITVHPVDLALRDSERIGRRDLWVRHRVGRKPSGVPAWDTGDAWLDMDENITAALALARLLQRLPAADNPLVSAARAAAWLGPLAPGAGGFDEQRFARWRAAHGPDGRRPASHPALLRAAEAASAWMGSGIVDRPDAAQALAIAAGFLRRAGALCTIPLPVWASWTALCRPDDPAVLPRLRGDVAARLAPGGAPWPVVFLHLVTEAARTGMRTLAGLRAAEGASAALAAGQDRRSRLPAAIALLLRHPALTAPSLARTLCITPQAALRILGGLKAANMVGEITGRKSFQAFGIP